METDHKLKRGNEVTVVGGERKRRLPLALERGWNGEKKKMSGGCWKRTW